MHNHTDCTFICSFTNRILIRNHYSQNFLTCTCDYETYWSITDNDVIRKPRQFK